MSHDIADLPPSTDPNASSDLVLTTPSATPAPKKARPTFHFVAGLGSGVCSAILLQPVDLLKTRVQQSQSSTLFPVLRVILASPNPVYNLWRGTVPSALRTGFGSALYFTTLNSLRQIVANNASRTPTGAVIVAQDGTLRSSSSSVLPKLSPTGNLMTGATARVLAGFILMPVTVIKVRYESDFYAYKSLTSATASIYKTEGLRGFFSGFGATAVRDAPYAGLYVVFYESSKSYLSRLVNPVDSLTNAPSSSSSSSPSSPTTAAPINATSSVIAAGLATAITNPFDAVKTRLQLMPHKYQNMLTATRIMLRDEGVKSFFDGLALRMGRKAVSSALVWTVYEELIGRAEKQLFLDRQAKSSATL